MIRTRFGLLVLALSLWAAPALQAQTQPTEGVRFGLGAGLLLPVGNYSNSDKAGANILGIIQMPLNNSEVHLRGTGMWGSTAHKVGAGSTNLVGATADLLLHVGERASTVRPYVMGGVGFFNVSNAGSRVALGLGGGILFGLGDMHAFLETRYMSIQTSGSSLNFMPITLGLMFRS
jgi:hypothetical protein